MRSLIKLALVSLLGVCLIAPVVNAQDASNFPELVLDLSRTNSGGSARILGLGGTQTAIGGDISSVSSNPAGLGFFNRSEFSFSSQFNGLNAESTYLGNSAEDSKLNFNIPNLGAVINFSKGNGKWKSQSFGVSLNRTADFQQRLLYQGNNSNFDFIRSAVEQDNFFGFTSLTDLAFNVDLTTTVDYTYNGEDEIFIDGIPTDVEEFFGRIPNIGETFELTERNIFDNNTGELGTPSDEFPVFTEESIDIRGSNSQFSLSYGANYDDKVYLGGGIGIASFNKDVERTLAETPTGTDLERLTLVDNYEQNGVGINANFGLIVRPIEFALIGLSYRTPTFYTVSQIQELELSAEYSNGDFLIDGVIFEEFNYNITSPSRISAGATFFLGKNGFITGEVERIQYSGGRLSNVDDPAVDENLVNADIDAFNSTNNFRLGAEFRYEIFRVRGGFAYMEDPVDNDLDQDEQQFSFGLGIRKKNYYADAAFVRSDGFASRISPYPGAPQANVEQSATRVTFTVGFTF